VNYFGEIRVSITSLAWEGVSWVGAFCTSWDVLGRFKSRMLLSESRCKTGEVEGGREITVTLPIIYSFYDFSLFCEE
jgi:hypothetical protein